VSSTTAPAAQQSPLVAAVTAELAAKPTTLCGKVQVSNPAMVCLRPPHQDTTHVSGSLPDSLVQWA